LNVFPSTANGKTRNPTFSPENEALLLKDLSLSAIPFDSIVQSENLLRHYDVNTSAEALQILKSRTVIRWEDKKDIKINIEVKDLSRDVAIQIAKAFQKNISAAYLNQFRSGIGVMMKKQQETIRMARVEKDRLIKNLDAGTMLHGDISSMAGDSVISFPHFESLLRNSGMKPADLLAMMALINRISDLERLIRESAAELYYLEASLKLDATDLIYESDRKFPNQSHFSFSENMLTGGKYLGLVLLGLVMVMVLYNSVRIDYAAMRRQ
jgi:hypothetical protein